ncbi:MAG: 4-hydroxy-tetrahydrodipicolinate reductase, partial [Planctomycetia bacterium]|nr:4-hydroxy-tetrahydrodipicolinate reductase [Planctomycetia bacterium]
AVGMADPRVRIVAALDRPGHPDLGTDVGTLAGLGPIGVPMTDSLSDDCSADVLIDFSLPEAVPSAIELAVTRKLPLVIATTGLTPELMDRIHEAASVVPVVQAPSMSLAVNLTMKLTEIAARALADQDADVEILERHHRFKEDAPSGTALKFGQIVASVMGQTTVTHGRSGRPGKRPHNEIGYHAIRTGDNPGEHTILFGMSGETIELTVRASNRDCYATGAFAAAMFIADRSEGWYSMQDVLGL